MKKKFLYIIALICICGSANGQDSSATGSFIMANVPQYFINSGFRLDFEKRICRKSNTWIVLAPQFYLNEKNSSDDNGYTQSNRRWDKMMGYGADLYFKSFLKKDKPSGLYFGYGLTFQQYTIEYRRYDWRPYTENGLEYYDYPETKVKETIINCGGNLFLGVQALISNRVIMDFYFGMGVRYSDIKANSSEERIVYKYWWNYGYTGILPIAGFKIGFVL